MEAIKLLTMEVQIIIAIIKKKKTTHIKKKNFSHNSNNNSSHNSNNNFFTPNDNDETNQNSKNNINYELTEADKAKMRKQKLILYTIVSIYLIFIAVSVIRKKLRK